MRLYAAWFTIASLAPSVATAAEPADAAPPVVEPTSSASVAADPGGAEPTGATYTSAPPVMDPREDPVGSGAPRSRGPQKQMSLYMGSPIWLTDSPLDPGFEAEIRSGLKIKSWVPEVGVGARWNWFNVDKLRQQYPGIASPNRYAGENLSGWWLSLGIRFEPNLGNTKLQPYVSVAFDANLWGFSYETTDACGFWSCYTVRRYDFAPGFSSRVGLRIQPNANVGIDLGAKPAMTFQGWAFESTHAWIEPYAGFTVMLDAPRR